MLIVLSRAKVRALVSAMSSAFLEVMPGGKGADSSTCSEEPGEQRDELPSMNQIYSGHDRREMGNYGFLQLRVSCDSRQEC